jgi:hypothetical protein
MRPAVAVPSTRRSGGQSHCSAESAIEP